MTFHLRPIKDTPEDVEVLLSLVKELAEYEKSPESAKATPALIRQNIFQHHYADAVLAVVCPKLLRAALTSTWYADRVWNMITGRCWSAKRRSRHRLRAVLLQLLDLDGPAWLISRRPLRAPESSSTWGWKGAVCPAGQDCSRKRLRSLRLGCPQVEHGPCSSCPISMPMLTAMISQPAIKFYESINAQNMTEWQGMRLEGEPLANLELLEQNDRSRQ